MYTDPISDMLTRIRNANSALHPATTMPSSKIKEEIARLGSAKILIVTERVATYMREHELIDTFSAAIAEIPDKHGGRAGADLQDGLDPRRPASRVVIDAQHIRGHRQHDRLHASQPVGCRIVDQHDAVDAANHVIVLSRIVDLDRRRIPGNEGQRLRCRVAVDQPHGLALRHEVAREGDLRAQRITIGVHVRGQHERFVPVDNGGKEFVLFFGELHGVALRKRSPR